MAKHRWNRRAMGPPPTPRVRTWEDRFAVPGALLIGLVCAAFVLFLSIWPASCDLQQMRPTDRCLHIDGRGHVEKLVQDPLDELYWRGKTINQQRAFNSRYRLLFVGGAGFFLGISAPFVVAGIRNRIAEYRWRREQGPNPSGSEVR